MPIACHVRHFVAEVPDVGHRKVDTVRRKRLIAIVFLTTGLAGACGEAQSPTAPSTVTETVQIPESRDDEGSSNKPPEAEKAKVPKVVGLNHQLAQDKLQAAGFYDLRERDATGQGRMLVWDRNWEVVSQSVKPGTVTSTDTTITLSSKKLGE